MKQHRLIILLIIILAYSFVHAAYLTNMPVTLTQPDGSKIECYASGDEYHNWLHDADKYTIIRHPETGFYSYADLIGGQVQATNLVVGKDLPIGIAPGVNISEEDYKIARNTKFAMPESRDAPTTGTINNVVIFIRFAGESEFGQNISTYDGWFNSNASSQKNYFLEASYNQLTVNSHFYPVPSSGFVVSWQDSNPRSYYQPYHATTNPNGYNGDTERRNREFTLLGNACNGVNSAIPSNLVIDSDNDGRVDNVVFIISGSSDGWSDLLWPHRWAIYDRTVYLRGKRVYDFNLQLRDFLNTQNVGVICHEFFHTLGAPDLYHYTSNGISPVGSWDLMEANTNPPQHMGAYMKHKYGNWISSIPTITADQAYTLNPLTMSTGQAYRINSTHPNQYYVMEYRRKMGTFENSLPGSGLLVYRIDTRYNGNASGPPDEVYLYRPNGTPSVNGSISSANFSLETGRTVINGNTNPYPFLQDGSMGNLSLYDIGSATGATISFTKGSPAIVAWDFSEAPYREGFEGSVPPTGWQNLAINGSYSFERVTSGTYPSCSPYEASAMIRYASWNASNGSSAILVSPKLMVPNTQDLDYQLSFYMYRDNGYSNNADRIELYLNSSPSLSGTPISIGTVNRSSNLNPQVSGNGWHRYSYDLPLTAGGTQYIIFKAVSAYGNNMFLDDFRLTTSLKLPFNEDFDSYTQPALPPSFRAIVNSSSSSAYVRTSSSLKYSEPNSLQLTNSGDAAADLRWVSPSINQGINRIRLRFQARSSSTGQTLLIGTQSDPASAFNLLQSVELSTSWSLVDLNLAGYSGSDQHLVFKHGLGGTYRSIYLDDLEIVSLPAYDLSLQALSGPAYAADGNNLSYSVQVKNESYNPMQLYTVQLLNAQTSAVLSQDIINAVLQAGNSATHTLICNLPNPGMYQIIARVLHGSDSVSDNNSSLPLATHILAPDAQIHHMSDASASSTANSLPFNFYWKNSVTESIYLAEEIFFPNGTIAGIEYHYEFVQDLAAQPLKVWIKNTDAQDLSSGWLSSDGYTLVFDSVLDFAAGSGSVFLSFLQPFVYTGGNLAIRANRPMDSVYYLSGNHFRQYSSPEAPNRSRHIQSDSIVYDPLAPPAGTLSSLVPQLTLLLQDITLDIAQLQVNREGADIMLSWSPIAGARSYQIWHSTDMQSWQLISTQANTELTTASADKAFFKVVASSDAPRRAEPGE